MVRRAEKGGKKEIGRAKQGFVMACAHASLPFVDCELCLIPSQAISHGNWQHHRAADLHSSRQPVTAGTQTQALQLRCGDAPACPAERTIVRAAADWRRGPLLSEGPALRSARSRPDPQPQLPGLKRGLCWPQHQ